MKKSCLAVLSGLAFGGAVIVNAPYAWSQAGQSGTGAAPSAGQKSGSETQIQKPTDPPMSGGRSSTSRSEGSGTESRMGGGQHWSKDKVKAIQEALKTKGFDPGAADGVMGPKTGQALREFQKSQNLQVTGRIDDKTASALGVDSGAGSMGSSSTTTGKESTSGGRSSGTGSQSSTSSEKEKTGSQTGSEPEKSGARGGTTTSPPSKPTGRE
jgi:peptidoglycan hydrolase-like protein with peptidoglycan-binding domain